MKYKEKKQERHDKDNEERLKTVQKASEAVAKYRSPAPDKIATKILKTDWSEILKYILVTEDLSDNISSFKKKQDIINKLKELEWIKHFEIPSPQENGTETKVPDGSVNEGGNGTNEQSETSASTA